jgi:hypothetical protein
LNRLLFVFVSGVLFVTFLCWGVSISFAAVSGWSVVHYYNVYGEGWFELFLYYLMLPFVLWWFGCVLRGLE